MQEKDLVFQYSLRLADDALILGHRLGELCGKGPILEEDLALTNIALDMIGRAEAILRYAGELEGKGRSEDDLAYRRPERKYQNHLICEQANGDFAHTIVRQFFISQYEILFYENLMQSKNQALAAIASKAIKEIKYHCRHASDWCVRLGDGTEESKERMQNAIEDLWMYTGELFEMDDIDQMLSDAGIAVNNANLEGKWKSNVMDVLSQAGLKIPEVSYMQTGSKQGIHTEQLGYILADMQYLQRAYPDATW